MGTSNNIYMACIKICFNINAPSMPTSVSCDFEELARRVVSSDPNIELAEISTECRLCDEMDEEESDVEFRPWEDK